MLVIVDLKPPNVIPNEFYSWIICHIWTMGGRLFYDFSASSASRHIRDASFVSNPRVFWADGWIRK